MTDLAVHDDSLPPAEYQRQMTPMEMLDRAISAGANPDVLGQLMALHERWEAREARKAFDEAIAAAKAEIPVIRKNRHVGFDSKKAGAARTDYWHEDFAEIARTVTPILGQHGLSYRFRTSSPAGQPVSVTCILSHRSGHFEENELSAGKDETGNKNSIQAIGSTITFLQRYTLKAALGLAAAKDDDAVAASEPTVEPLSEQDILDAKALLKELGDDVRDRLFRYYKIDAVDDLPPADFAAAWKYLQKIREEKRLAAVEAKP